MAQSCRLGPWTYKPASARLIGPAGDRQLTPQLNRLLTALIEADERTLSKDALLEKVWNGRIVTDDAIARAVSELRKALRWNGAAEAIQTLHGFGYRLDLEVKAETSPTRLKIFTIAFLIIVLACLAAYLISRQARPGLQVIAVTPMSEFTRLDAANRYLPVRQHLLYLAPGPTGQSLYLGAADGPVALVTDRQFGEVAASPDGQQVAYLDLGDRCELRLLTIESGENVRLADCLEKATHALGFSSQGSLLFGQLSGKRMSVFTFASAEPEISDIGAGDCRQVKHVAQRGDGRTYLSCAVERGDVLFEIAEGQLIERLSYRSITKFAVDEGEAFYLLHAPRWKSGITRFIPPDDFAFLQTGWALDMALSDSSLVMVRDLTNPDLMGIDLDDGKSLSFEEGPVHTQAFTVDEEGDLWQLDDRAGRLALYRNDQAVPILDEEMLDFTFSDVSCMSVDSASGAIEFSVPDPAGVMSDSRHDLGTGALLSVAPESECADQAELPEEFLDDLRQTGHAPRQAFYDRPRHRLLYITDHSPYLDIARLELTASH